MVALTVPHRLYFSGSSRIWGGSPAFIDTETAGDGHSLARAYLIRWDQFEDVVAQENGRPVAPIEIDDHELEAGFCRGIGPGRYECLLCTERSDDVPVVTFTAPWTMRQAPVGCPSAGYLAMLIAGLRQAHALRDEELTEYLGTAPGCHQDVLAEALRMVPRSPNG
jgi:hypothetical protein